MLTEHAMVRVVHDCQVDGYRLGRDALGVVVCVYAFGEAYAVELENVAGQTVVVTLQAGDVVAA